MDIACIHGTHMTYNYGKRNGVDLFIFPMAPLRQEG